LPGHSEEDFAELLLASNGRKKAPGPRADDDAFTHVPLFDKSQLDLYPPGRLTLPVQFTRGCSYGRCTFCTYPVVEPEVTALRPASALAAIRSLVEVHGIRRFSLKDSLVTGPMLEVLGRTFLDAADVAVEWSATTKVHRRLIGLAPLLAESGLRTVELGVETVHDGIQRLFDKRARVTDIHDVVSALTGHGIAVVMNLIFGAPGESEREALQQISWFTKIRNDAPPGLVDCSLNMLEIVRGSPLATDPPEGVTIDGIAPWAYCYQWNAPSWRPNLTDHLRTLELA
jgi:radical SAM superfamily enzyme YgiQ (UPF0313 family)